jgi:hypothetical protein
LGRERKMPSIEIHNFSVPGAQAMKERIEGLLLGTPSEGMSITVLPDIITDTGYRRPFIKFLSRPQEAEEVLRALRILKRGLPNLKIEYVEIPRLGYSE